MSISKTIRTKVFPLFLAVLLVVSQFAGAVAFPAAVSAQEQQTVSLVEWNFNDETATATGGVTSNLDREININGASFKDYITGYDGNAKNSEHWHTESDSYWMIELSTLGFGDLTLSSKQRGSASGPRDFKIEYSLDGSTWMDVPNSDITVRNNWTSGVLNKLELPSEMNNQDLVYIRWIKTSDYRVDGNTGVWHGGTNRIDMIVVNGLSLDTGELPPTEDPTDELVDLTIKDARSMVGQEVTVEGIANIDQGSLHASNFSLFIQDEEAGIQLFSFNPSQFPAVKKGDLVRATGIVGHHSGVTQLQVSEVEVLESNQEVPVRSVDLSTYMNASLADELEGQLVRFEGFIRNINNYFNGGVSIGIINNDFDAVDIRVWESTGIDLDELSPYTWYEITAVSSRFNANYQVLPRSNADFRILADQRPEPTTLNREFQVEIGRVVDGDTITLKTPVLGATNVRFLNMDTAETYHTVRNELDQHQMDHGNRATAHMQTMLEEGDIVTLRLGSEPIDGFGRLLAEVISPSGVNTNLQMVRDGHAPTYFIYPLKMKWWQSMLKQPNLPVKKD
ncbi:MAG: thermonuclease family protein [Bacillus sp. (in: Bacteria)]|nr:thermonuclease family protein [Bacillus sp. (in: firmicutes)]